jgi:anti-anti-sigma factor
MESNDGHLDVEEHGESGGRVRLTLRGSLDIASARQLDQRLRLLARTGCGVDLDLERVEFIDLVGLRVIVLSLERSRGGDARATVVRNVSTCVARLAYLVGAELWPSSTGPTRLVEPSAMPTRLRGSSSEISIRAAARRLGG